MQLFRKQYFFILLLLLLTGCVRQQRVGVFIDPAFGTLIAPDTKLIAGVRLDKLRETPLYKKLSTEFDLERRLNLFAERTGLDPRKDMWEVLFVSNGMRGIVLARGRFTTGEMEPQLGDLGKARRKYKDYTIIGTAATSVVFLNPGVAAAGTQQDIENLIDHRAEYSDVPQALNTKLKSLPADDQVWLVSDGVFPSAMLEGPDTTGAKSMAANIVSSLKSVRLGLHASDGLELGGTIDCVSAEGARRVRDTLKGIIGMGRLSTKDDQLELLKVYDSVTVKQNDASVDIAASVGGNLVDPLLRSLVRKR